MIGLAVALIIVGLVLFFIIPAVGIAAGIVGLLLLGAFALGFGRRAAR